MFADAVRTDWVYPPRKPPTSSDAAGGVVKRESGVTSSKVNPFLQAKEAEPVMYRERFYSTSDDDDMSSVLDEEMEDDEDGDVEEEEDEEDEEDEQEQGPEETVRRSSLAKDSDEVNGTAELAIPSTPKRKRPSARFETPDSVADYVGRRLEAVKRKKRRVLEEELQWNEGLCFFQKRRNVWTAAVSPEKAQSNMDAKDTFILGTQDMQSVGLSGLSLEYAPSPQVTPSTEEPPPPYPLNSVKSDGTSNTETSEAKVKTGDQEEEDISPFKPPTNISSLTNILIPISSPILPDTHPVRANILSRTDQELYEKLVRDSRTPAVPINLSHMMRVIVQGWKDEGNWPPRGTLPEASLIAKRARAFTDGTSIGNGGSSATTGGKDGAGKGFMANHPHLKQGVESFKRVLRLSSGGSAGERSRTPSVSGVGLVSAASPVEGKGKRPISISSPKTGLEGVPGS
jgi:hypothetical protein